MHGFIRRSLAGLALVAGIAPLAAAQTAPTVDEIIARNIKAKGGEQKWKSLQSMRLTGSVSIQGTIVPMTVLSKRPNLARQEMTIQGTQIVQAFDGTTAWTINPSTGGAPQALTGPEAENARDQADFDSVLMDYRAKGHTIELVGQEKLDGHDVYHLKVNKKNGQTQDYFLDTDTGLERRVTSSIASPTGERAVIGSELSNYRDVDGVMVPFSIRNTLNGTPVTQLTIEKVEFNVPLDEALFKMPKKES